MTRIFPAILLSALAMLGQQLTVAPSAVPGIELVGPQSPEFPALVTQIVGTDRPAALAASLSYGVVMRNRTSQAIAAIDTVWTTDDRVLLNAADTMFNKPVFYVKTGQDALLVPPGILENPGQLWIFADGALEGHRLENFRNPGNVTVALDAVVFESGQFVGANRYRAFEQWQAQLQAPRDLASSVLQKQQSQSIGDIVSSIEQLAAVRRPPPDPHASDTVFAARVLLAAYRTQGEAGLYSCARSMLSTSAFPLHR